MYLHCPFLYSNKNESIITTTPNPDYYIWLTGWKIRRLPQVKKLCDPYIVLTEPTENLEMDTTSPNSICLAGERIPIFFNFNIYVFYVIKCGN